MKKILKSNEINGFISAQMKSAKSISFCADLPKGIEVDYIRLIGEVDVNGTKFVNPIINDIDGVMPVYHLESEDGTIATVYFEEGIPAKVLSDVQNYILEQFEVVYEVCPYCGK